MEIASYTITHNGLTEGTLEATIDNLDEFADYKVVCVSESSDDGTLEWCRENEKIDSVITEDKEFPRQEAEIRRMAFDEAKSFDTEWIAAIDDDEIIGRPEIARRKLNQSLHGPRGFQGVDIVAAKLYHMWEGKKFRSDGTWEPGEVSRPIFYNTTTDFEGNFGMDIDVHTGRIPTNDQSRVARITGHIDVIHFGWYIPQEERIEKMETKRALDDIEGKDTEYAQIQREHYESVYDEPHLQDLPKSYTEGREHLFKFKEE